MHITAAFNLLTQPFRFFPNRTNFLVLLFDFN